MSTPRNKPKPVLRPSLEKCPTGIAGLDEITNGGLPKGRTTLVCGSSGSGKTLLGMEFLVKGAMEYGENGVFVSFEESAKELAQNVDSLGFDVPSLIAKKRLAVDYVRIVRSEIEETGEYDLEGLFIRLGYAIDSVGAKRVVLDTLEALFAALTNIGILRAELRRLFGWLKERGVTAIITGERGDGTLTRYGLEEYVSDCVILLDQRISDQIATRHLRIIKYRGSVHGTNEYPFLLDEGGFTVVPVTSIGLRYEVPTDFVSTGIPKLDAMLDNKGFYRGATILVSGSSGSGKSSVGAHFADAACRRGERCLYCLFEESPDQVMRNMRSIGIDLKQWVEKGLLHFQPMRPSAYGLEMHLALIQRSIEKLQPKIVLFDPISSFAAAGTLFETKAMLARLIDYLKSRQITAMMTALTSADNPVEQSEVGISSLIDIWVLLRNLEQGGERTRTVYILKARGTDHSNKVREFLLSDRGIDLVDVYMGPGGILTGSARTVQEMKDRADKAALEREVRHKQEEIDRKRDTLEARITELKAEFEIERMEIEDAIAQAREDTDNQLAERREAGVKKKSRPSAQRKTNQKGRK